MEPPKAATAPWLGAWRPAVSGVREVLHARFFRHAYPSHTHDTWTLLVVDVGTAAYGLEHDQHATLASQVTLLPPHVAHDGRSATSEGFRKRVIYLDVETIGSHRVGRAVDHPSWRDPTLRTAVHHLHNALHQPGGTFEAEGRLGLVTERLAAHLDRRQAPTTRRDPHLARRLRDLLDSHLVEGIALADAAVLLQASPTHLVRAFRHETGMPPHRYLTGRRLDRARTLLLEGHKAAEVATVTGFHDQAHLTRHFRQLLGVTPGVYAASVRTPHPPRLLAATPQSVTEATDPHIGMSGTVDLTVFPARRAD